MPIDAIGSALRFSRTKIELRTKEVGLKMLRSKFPIFPLVLFSMLCLFQNIMTLKWAVRFLRFIVFLLQLETWSIKHEIFS